MKLTLITIFISLLFNNNIDRSGNQDTNDSLFLQELGKIIYTTGTSPFDRKIKATVSGDVIMASTMACIKCHGETGREHTDDSGIEIPDIRWMTLGQQLDESSQHGQKKDDLIRKAITKTISLGVGLDGQVLHAMMPRYMFTQDEMKCLIAYLEILGKPQVEGSN